MNRQLILDAEIDYIVDANKIVKAAVQAADPVFDSV